MFEWFTNPDIWHVFGFFVLDTSEINNDALLIPGVMWLFIIYLIQIGVFKWNPFWSLCSFAPVAGPASWIAFWLTIAPIATIFIGLSFYLLYMFGDWLRGRK